MKKGKKFLSLALALLLALGCLPLTAEAEEIITVKELIPPQYDMVEDFSEGMAAVCTRTNSEEKWGFIDTAGQEVVSPQYNAVQNFSGGLAAVWTRDDRKWCFIDTTGKEVTPRKYDQVRDCSEGMAAICVGDYPDDKWGFIDTTGREVIPPQYNVAYSFLSGLAAVCTGDYPHEKWGFIDTTGKEVTPQKYDQVRDCSEGLAAVCVGKHPDEKWGFVDTTGREVVPPRYEYVWAFSEGFAVVELNGKWGFVDQTGAEAIPLQYDGTVPFSNGFARIVQNGKIGFIDKTGTVVIPPEYDSARDFSEGLAAVCVGEYPDIKWGFIDTTGKKVVEPKYTSVEDFSEGMAVVRTHSLVFSGPACSGFIDKTGAEVIPVKVNYCVESFSHGLALAKNGTFFGDHGFLDKTGKEAVPLTYQEARSFSEGFAAVGVGESLDLADKWGFLKIESSNPPVNPDPPVNPGPDPDKPQISSQTFIDVSPGDYSYDAVQWAVENEITSGTSATKFSPNQGCTRAQAVTFLWRAAGSPEPASAVNPFTDVKSEDCFYKAVLWAVEKGVTSGTSATKFSPNGKCTRAQIVTFQHRAAGSPAAGASGAFSDVTPDAYYAGAVAWAVENNITSGTSATKFSPNGKCTRGQIVTFLYRGSGT